MARTRTLAGMEADVRWLADIQSLTLRHTSADLRRAINQSVQRFRELVSANAINHYLVNVVKTMTAGPTSPYPFRVIDVSTEVPEVTRVYSVDAIINGVLTPLVPEPFSARADYQNGRGCPAAFANMTTYEVIVMPAPDAEYNVLVWYLPKLDDMEADDDTFDGIAGYEQWIDWDVLLKVIQRDTAPQLYATATAEREKIERDMVKALGAVNQRTVGVRRDSARARGWPHSKTMHSVGEAGGPGIFDATFDWSYT